jgi:hypothetical protein
MSTTKAGKLKIDTKSLFSKDNLQFIVQTFHIYYLGTMQRVRIANRGRFKRYKKDRDGTTSKLHVY